MWIWRRRKLFKARAALEHDFFGGWKWKDATLFEKFAVKASPRKYAVTDFLGIHTDMRCAPWAAKLANKVISDPPIPHDRNPTASNTPRHQFGYPPGASDGT